MNARTIGQRIDDCAYNTAFAIVNCIPGVPYLEDPIRGLAVRALARSVLVLRMAATAVAVAPDHRIPRIDVDSDPRFRELAVDAIEAAVAALQPS